jgi:hypothetical protein
LRRSALTPTRRAGCRRRCSARAGRDRRAGEAWSCSIAGSGIPTSSRRKSKTACSFCLDQREPAAGLQGPRAARCVETQRRLGQEQMRHRYASPREQREYRTQVPRGQLRHCRRRR